jgi:hypothetical protein
MATKDKTVENTDTLNDDGELNFENLSLEKLRKYCSFYRIPISNTASKEEVVEAIKGKMKGRDIAVVAEAGNMPAPGWARIELQRDPSPGSSNRPVYVAVNGYRITVPRGVTVDVPKKIVDVLNDAKEWKLVENHDEPLNSPKRYIRQPVLSYPFQVHAITPGPDPRPGYEKSKMAHYGPRKEFHDMFGRWPKKSELLEAQKEGFIKLKQY